MMKIHCWLCNCPITISPDMDKAVMNVDTHLFGKQHRWNMRSVQEGILDTDCSLFCHVCNMSILMSVNSNNDTICKVNEHIHSQNHADSVNMLYHGGSGGVNDEDHGSSDMSQSDQYYNENIDDNDVYNSNEDSDYEYNSGDYEDDGDDFSYTDQEYEIGGESDDEYSDEEDNEEPITLCFYCCTCDYNINVSKISEFTVEQLVDHIEGPFHQGNQNSGGPKRMRCMTCERNINLSFDYDKSFSNIMRHMYGKCHSSRVPQEIDLPTGLYYPD